MFPFKFRKSYNFGNFNKNKTLTSYTCSNKVTQKIKNGCLKLIN